MRLVGLKIPCPLGVRVRFPSRVLQGKGASAPFSYQGQREQSANISRKSLGKCLLAAFALPIPNHGVFVDAPQAWQLPVNRAISSWNVEFPNALTRVSTVDQAVVTVTAKCFPKMHTFGVARIQSNRHVAIELSTCPPLGRREKRSVACHELGHALGIPHTPEPTCMNPAAWHPFPRAVAV
jgi:predicted Zn-dependent protease